MLKRKLCIISLLFVCYLSAYGQQVTGAEAAKAAVTIMHIADCSSAATLMSDYSVNGVFEDLPADTLSSPKSLLQSASFADDATLKVYPNPTNDLLHIELVGGACIASAALFDLQGRTVAGAVHRAREQLNRDGGRAWHPRRRVRVARDRRGGEGI